MIEVSKLNKTYQPRSRHANHVLHDVSLTLPDTGFICILGPSGCGKTSLLNAIGGLDVFDSGRITVDQITVNRPNTPVYNDERNRSFGYIFQNYYLLPEHSAGYNVYLGLHCLKLSHKEKLERVKDALKAVEMERYIRRNVGELSGGQQQRVAIARAIARRPRVIFADEPTGNLDEANTLNICTLLRQISKTSLVIMVTHEERIANFFADRIITLSDGKIQSDSNEWKRGNIALSEGSTLFAGDYSESNYTSEQVKLRILAEENAAPVELTVMTLKDQIIIKLSDSRTVQVTAGNEPPVLVEGCRPALTLDELDQTGDANPIIHPEEVPVPTRAGWGIRFRDLLKEAVHINRQTGLRSVGARIFLVILAILTVITTGDFLTVASVDPEKFIVTDSHILTVTLERGPNVDSLTLSIDALVTDFVSRLPQSGLDYDYIPAPASSASISSSMFLQTDDVSSRFDSFSYVPVHRLEENDLLYGRMPQNGQEIVVDRWVLDNLMSEDGILQNGIMDIRQFLGKHITYSKKVLAPEIVGICDSGEPAVYVHPELMSSIGIKGTEIASLSSLKAMYPGEYDHIQLSEEECIVLPANAGEGYTHKIGTDYLTLCGFRYRITQALDISDFYPKIIVADSQVEVILHAMTSPKFYLYCQDKAAMTSYLRSIPEVENGMLLLHVSDQYGTAMNAYQEATRIRLDARLIVTVSIIILALVMLYLLRRSQVQEQIGMLSVYCLLGIPKGKLCTIFILESLLTTAQAVLPTVFAVWGIIAVLRSLPSIALNFILPLTASLAVYGAVAVYHLLVTLIPLVLLLSLPPAQLAAKYDF